MQQKRSRTSQFLCLLAGMLLIQVAQARTILLFGSLDALLIYSRLGSTQQVALFNNLSNTYVSTTSWEDTKTLIFGVGARTFQNEIFQFNTSVRYIPMPFATLNGQVWQLNQSRFNNLTYSYKLRTNLLLVENTVSWRRFIIQPGFILGIGGARNTAGGYLETPLSTSIAPAMSTFTEGTSSQFAYEVGAALDYFFNHTAIELAYRWINTGNVSLGRSPIQNTTDQLSSGNLNYQTISLGVRLYYDLTI